MTNGKKFPQVLRELLFLCGKKGPIFSYGRNSGIKELHDTMVSYLGPALKKVIERPFLIISDDGGHNVGFGFVFLDDGADPKVRQVSDYHWTGGGEDMVYEIFEEDIILRDMSLSELVDRLTVLQMKIDEHTLTGKEYDISDLVLKRFSHLY